MRLQHSVSAPLVERGHWWTVRTQQPHATWLTFLGHNLRLASQEEEQTLTEDMEETVVFAGQLQLQ